MDRPEIRYTKTVDGVHIAYQVFGDGPVDLVCSFGEVSNIDVDEGQNGEIALLVQKVTGGNYVAVSSGGTTALASSILPAVAQKISLRYLKQMTQHRIVFVRTPGATGPMQNLRVAFANHPGAHVIVSTDGNLP